MSCAAMKFVNTWYTSTYYVLEMISTSYIFITCTCICMMFSCYSYCGIWIPWRLRDMWAVISLLTATVQGTMCHTCWRDLQYSSFSFHSEIQVRWWEVLKQSDLYFDLFLTFCIKRKLMLIIHVCKDVGILSAILVEFAVVLFEK